MQGLNNALITLLPKKAEATQAGDYRPISLIHSFANLVAKMMALRLAPKLRTLIDTNRSAFVKQRSIDDNFRFVQAAAKMFQQRKTPKLLLKLDITKAFDTVSWPFLLHVLQFIGFGHRWRNWLSILLATASTRIKLQRGLRQGDPLSPMLFLLIMDVLHRLIRHAAEGGMLQPIGHRAITHQCSLYADEAVLFIAPAEQDLLTTKSILEICGSPTGLRANMSKCIIVPICCSDQEIARIQEHFPCQTASFPITYLGIPLSTHKLKKEYLEPVVQAVRNRLPRWKAGLMNKAGRRAHVKETLSAMPVHTLKTIKQANWMILAIDKTRRGFFWAGEHTTSRGQCTMAWQRITRPLQYGGLRITDLQIQGRALNIKWLWLQRTDATKPWAGLPMDCDKQTQEMFNASVQIIPVNGGLTKFWSDRWLQSASLPDITPDLCHAVASNTRRSRTLQ